MMTRQSSGPRQLSVVRAGTLRDRRVIPPLDPYDTRTPADPKQGTTVATIEGYVTAAEQNGGGWVQLTFHHICSGCDAYSITQVTSGAVAVETTEQVIGGTFKPAFCC